MKKMLVMIIVFSLTLSGCIFFDSQGKAKEDAFQKLYLNIKFNEGMRFVKPSATYHIGDLVDIDLENLSSEDLLFSSNYGLSLLMYQNDRWVNIKDGMIDLSPGQRLLSSKKTGMPGIKGISFSPEVTNTGQSVLLRVVVLGHSRETNLNVGAYIDITLQP